MGKGRRIVPDRSQATSATEFVGRLTELLATPLTGEDAEICADALERAAARLRAGRAPSRCRIVPFIPGRRPTDEARTPGLGSSDQVAMIFGHAMNGRGPNRAYVLYELDDEHLGDATQVDATLSLTGPDGTDEPRPLPGWDRRPVDRTAFTLDDAGRPVLRPARPSDRKLVVEIDPEADLAGAALDGEDPYGFEARFLQRMRLDLRLCEDGVPVAASTATLDVCSVPRLGSLYQRVVERVVAPDAARQAAATGQPDPGPAYHPWFPVLCIGGDKAALYTRALVGDIVDKGYHLTDPRWLLRVGVYLELLTCIGIAEATRDEHGDILEPEEREAFATAPQYEEIRRRVDVDAWKRVWALRSIAFPRHGVPRTGRVSALNLLSKKKATLAFLHVHHDDLKHAIELAGSNEHNAQETWQRVFRDAERAVLRQTAEAFPELGFLPPAARDFVLWHRKGRIEPLHRMRVPGAITGLIADQDGLFASACSQYRASMNDVADWAKARGLMDFTGVDCVPFGVSLLEAQEAKHVERVRVLQRRDGYGDTLDVMEPEPAQAAPVEDAVELLGESSLFSTMTPEQLELLARRARPLPLGPTQRVVVQGQPGTSLFVVADGEVEVVVRQESGEDVVVDTMQRGAVIGEMALLTGEPRAATVRATDGALVYEVGREQFDELLRMHPEWVDELASVMELRLADRARFLAGREAVADGPCLAAIVKRRLWGG